MSTLYVANATRQPHDFQYRVPGEDMRMLRRVQIQRLDPGTQQMIHRDAPLAVLEAIVAQHRPYGLVPVDEVVKVKEFVGLCYSFDKPVDLDRLQYAVDHNTGVLHDRGEDIRKETAAAADLAIQRNLEDQFRRSGGSLPRARLKAVEIESLEDGENPKYARGAVVDHDVPDGATSTRRTFGR